jgi:hypothetical protein
MSLILLHNKSIAVQAKVLRVEPLLRGAWIWNHRDVIDFSGPIPSPIAPGQATRKSWEVLASTSHKDEPRFEDAGVPGGLIRDHPMWRTSDRGGNERPESQS